MVVLIVESIVPLIGLRVLSNPTITTGIVCFDNEQLLTTVDDFVEVALGVPQLILLRGELEWLAQLADLRAQLTNLFNVSRVLHLKAVVLFDQRPNLLLQAALIECNKLIFKILLLPGG